ncbi:MAG: hypothetical protein H6621_00125 [Halobacteriovoraceae bacterium]|nr:hypothetical protein [Halobacteriovoraceae bacterium]MCB9093446.1 hypothetical protein [Halobacteriovoraceae bacterium]
MVNQPNKEKRVLLDERATALVSTTVQELRSRHCKVNPSTLAAASLVIFFEKYYEREKSELEKIFFDEKRFLRSAIQGSSNQEELAESIKEYLKKINIKPKSKRPSVQESKE